MDNVVFLTEQSCTSVGTIICYSKCSYQCCQAVSIKCKSNAVPLVFRFDEGSCSSAYPERVWLSVSIQTDEEQVSAPNCSWQLCQSMDPMSCFEWIATKHFLICQFMHVFSKMSPLMRTWWHNRGFPVPLCSLVPIFVTLCHSWLSWRYLLAHADNVSPF